VFAIIPYNHGRCHNGLLNDRLMEPFVQNNIVDGALGWHIVQSAPIAAIFQHGRQYNRFFSLITRKLMVQPKCLPIYSFIYSISNFKFMKIKILIKY